MKWAKIQENMQVVMGKFTSNRYIQALSDGLMTLFPLMIVGAMSSLLYALPIKGYQSFITSTGIAKAINIPYGITTGLIAIYAAYMIGYKLADSFDKDGAMGGILSLMAFFVVTPITMFDEKVQTLNMQYLGSQGLFVAIIVSLIASRIYVLILDQKWEIKLPESVPPTVSNSFNSLIPGIVIAVIFVVISQLVALTAYGNAHDLIIQLIQGPLQKLGANLPAALVLVFLMQFLWFLGIHGSMATMAILYAVYYPLDLANLNAFNAGSPLPYIVTMSFIMQQKGAHNLAFAILLAFKTKSTQLKTVGRLGLLPAVFGISEPLKFGVPMILNPYILVPMIGAPMVNIVISYFAIAAGWVPRLNGVMVPTGMPEIVKGIFMGGWQLVVLNVILLVVSILIYLPFVGMLDTNKVKAEAVFEKES